MIQPVRPIPRWGVTKELLKTMRLRRREKGEKGTLVLRELSEQRAEHERGQWVQWVTIGQAIVQFLRGHGTGADGEAADVLGKRFRLTAEGLQIGFVAVMLNRVGQQP